MFRLFSPWVLGTCLITVNLIFVLIAALVGWLPAIAGFLQRTFRGSLVLSYRLFKYLLSSADPFAEQYLGLRLSSGTPRILATVVLSLLFMGVILLLTPLDFSVWLLGFAVVHGLLVGFLWGDVLEPGSLHLGSRLQ